MKIRITYSSPYDFPHPLPQRSSPSPQMHTLSVNRLLHMGVDMDHLLVQVWMLVHHHLRVPGSSNEDGVDAAAQGSSEDVADLQSDDE